MTEDEGAVLLRLARAALEAQIVHGNSIELERFCLDGRLVEKHGAFVTLRMEGKLRGCMGYTSNTQPLAAAVCRSAVRSATEDPRFSPVLAHEVESLRVEVSALGEGDTPRSPFRRVGSVSEIVIGRDGILVRKGSKRAGLLLPQVATEQGWDVDQFLDAACRKAGLPPLAWEAEDVELFRFTAQVFRED